MTSFLRLEITSNCGDLTRLGPYEKYKKIKRGEYGHEMTTCVQTVCTSALVDTTWVLLVRNVFVNIRVSQFILTRGESVAFNGDLGRNILISKTIVMYSRVNIGLLGLYVRLHALLGVHCRVIVSIR